MSSVSLDSNLPDITVNNLMNNQNKAPLCNILNNMVKEEINPDYYISNHQVSGLRNGIIARYLGIAVIVAGLATAILGVGGLGLCTNGFASSTSMQLYRDLALIMFTPPGFTLAAGFVTWIVGSCKEKKSCKEELLPNQVNEILKGVLKEMNVKETELKTKKAENEALNKDINKNISKLEEMFNEIDLPNQFRFPINVLEWMKIDNSKIEAELTSLTALKNRIKPEVAEEEK